MIKFGVAAMSLHIVSSCNSYVRVLNTLLTYSILLDVDSAFYVCISCVAGHLLATIDVNLGFNMYTDVFDMFTYSHSLYCCQ